VRRLSLLLSFLFAIAVSSEEPQISGQQKMIALLKEVAAESRETNPILGEAKARELRKQFAAISEKEYGAQLPLLTELAEQEMRQAQFDESIRILKLARKAIEQAPPENVSQQTNMVTLYRLGIAYMRMGEVQNCASMHSAESCIMPIHGGGVHQIQEGSRQAMQYFTKLLGIAPENSPMALRARWLLNIAAMTIDQYPNGLPEKYRIPPEQLQSEEKFPRFENIAPKLGLDTLNLAGGAIAEDFNNDGYLDLFVSSWHPEDQLHFYINDHKGGFIDQSKKANLAGLTGGFNLVQADYNNDGFVDVLVLRGAWLGAKGTMPKSLLKNNGDGTFTDMTYESGLIDSQYPTQTAAWADYDNDGDLDLYIGNETAWEEQAPCQLFRNNGNGTFTDVAAAAGLQNMSFAKSVAWGDYDQDGDPDLYVSNLGAANRLYRNNGNGTFTDIAEDLGVSGPQWSFVSWFWDFDNDGALDIYVNCYDWSRGGLAGYVASLFGQRVPFDLPYLYKSDGHGGFKDVAAEENLTRMVLPMGANFGDLDNDGWLDFYLGTGYPDYEGLMPNVMYHNREGKRFVDITTAGGFGHLQKGHGVVFADFDRDGDQDVFEQMGGFYSGDRARNIFFQNPGFGNNWISIHLIGVKSNRSAIGARIRLDVNDNGKSRSIYKYVNSGASFGANSLTQSIGIGKAKRIERLEIFWPTTHLTQVFSNVAANQFIEITEGKDVLRTVNPTVSDKP
jgi:FG-GAP-like repeat/ASPIC and UnbV